MSHRSYSRILLLGLTAVIAITGLSVVATGSVAAQQVDVDPSDLSGEGTIEDPYVITNASELQAMESDTFSNYILGNDIRASNTSQWNNGKGFNPIGDDVFRSPTIPAFTATLDGKNHTLTGLTINRPSEKNVGLIGFADSDASIRNLRLRNITVIGDNNVGGIVGKNNGQIQNTTVTGSVIGDNDVGAIAGKNNGQIQDSKASGSVTSRSGAGGLVGDNEEIIQNVTATVKVNGSAVVGGVAGSNHAGTIQNAIAKGRVNGSRKVGGLVGSNTYDGQIEYAIAVGRVTGSEDVGGIVGISSGLNNKNIYWDTQATGQSNSDGDATGLTTAQMTGETAKAYMSGLDFDNTWTTTNEYPALRAFSHTDGGSGGDSGGGSADILVATDGSGDYISIQSAIDNADTGDRIRVSQGTYLESIDVSNNVDIVAPNGATISPNSNVVSAVALIDGTESRLVNLSIEGTNSIGLDARSSTGDWTAKNIEITGFRFGVTALGSKGDWVIDNSVIKNSNTRGIAPETSEGNWTIKSSTIRNVSGIGIDAYRIDAGVIKDTVIKNVTQKYEYDGIGITIDDTSGDWLIENVTVKNTEYDGIDAGDTNATHNPVIRDTTVIGTAEEGIDIAGSKSDFLITGSIVRDTGPGEYRNAIRVEDAQGNWTIQDTIIRNISGEGIDAYTQSEFSHATIQNLTINGTQSTGVNFYDSNGDWEIIDSHISNSEATAVAAGNSAGDWNITDTVILNSSSHGVGGLTQQSNSTAIIENITVINTAHHGVEFYNSSGEWTISNSTISNTGWSGIEGSDSSGDWSITTTTVQNSDDFLVGARRASGTWEIHQSKLGAATVGINATGAIKGNASYNHWGAADGPSGGFAGSGSESYGNVSVNPYYTDAALTTLGTVGQRGDEDSPDNATASVTTEPVTVSPGENVTVAFNVTNTGEINSSYILKVSLPSNVTPVAYSDAGGNRQANESKWLWQTIKPNESVTPSMTVQVPSNSSETYTLNASVLTNEKVVATTNTTITTGSVSINEGIDANGNNEIDDEEILLAIDYWQTDEAVPGTDGKQISDFEILELIEKWRDNNQI